uniref:Uncharacterized protein n=1 Tax=Amphimedon queenslandica TaxID=400682 RepID=A0A1X7UNU8_AMPQE
MDMRKKQDMEMALKEQRKTEREKRKAEKEQKEWLLSPQVVGVGLILKVHLLNEPSIGTRGKSKGLSPQPSLSIYDLINQIVGHALK